MPYNAECTTTGCSDAALRARTTSAMLRQLPAEDTLVPPNLSTTQAGLLCGTLIAHVKFNPVSSNRDISPQAGGVQGSAPIELLFVLENVEQFSL